MVISLAAIAPAAIALSLSSLSVGWAEGRATLSVDQQTKGVDILVAPGTHGERLVIDRPNTSLIAMSGRQHDLIIENVEPLSFLDKVMLVTGSRVRVEGYGVVRNVGGTSYVATIRVLGHAQ